MMVRSDPKPGLFRRPNLTDWLTFFVVTAFSLGAASLLAVAPEQPLVSILPFLGLAGAVLLWRYPIAGVFTLFIMSTLVENYHLHFPDSLTDNIAFWRNLSTSGISGVPVSPAELLMVGTIFVWFFRNHFARSLEVRRSTLFRSYGWYLLAVAVGFGHGVMTGGDTTMALWEIRTQVYGIIVFFLALNLLRAHAHFEMLGWIIILGTGIKGLQGSWRYLVTLGGHFEGNALLAHDEAFFFPAYYIFLLLLFVFGGSKRQKWIGVLLLPSVVIAEFANNRRTSTAVIIICLIVLAFMLFTIMRKYRLRVVVWSVIALMLGTLYVGAFWNSSSTFAQPVQAIKSQIAPSERDASSDLYRQQEDYNLMYAVKKDLIVGRGYGIPMENISGMADLSEITVFLFYFPHNSILWIWWRVGLIGFVLFWLAMGLAIVRNCFLARAATDPYLRRWAVFAVIVTMMMLLVGWWDQGIFMYRAIVYVWIVLAVPEALGASMISEGNSGNGELQ